MADELDINFPSSGSRTPYAIIRRESDGYVWDGSEFEAWADGSITDYDVALSSQGGDYWLGDFPTGITSAGYYLIQYRVRSGGSPTVSDQQYPGERFYWDGGGVAPGPSDLDGVTGYYADASDIEDEFGRENVARWSQLDNASSNADGDRAERALAYADALINDTFRDGPYAVPLAPVPVTVTRWAAVIAGHWLYSSRGMRDETPEGNHLQTRLDRVRVEMDQSRAGVVRLDCGRAQSQQPSVPVVVM